MTLFWSTIFTWKIIASDSPPFFPYELGSFSSENDTLIAYNEMNQTDRCIGIVPEKSKLFTHNVCYSLPTTNSSKVNGTYNFIMNVTGQHYLTKPIVDGYVIMNRFRDSSCTIPYREIQEYGLSTVGEQPSIFGMKANFHWEIFLFNDDYLLVKRSYLMKMSGANKHYTYVPTLLPRKIHEGKCVKKEVSKWLERNLYWFYSNILPVKFFEVQIAPSFTFECLEEEEGIDKYVRYIFEMSSGYKFWTQQNSFLPDCSVSYETVVSAFDVCSHGIVTKVKDDFFLVSVFPRCADGVVSKLENIVFFQIFGTFSIPHVSSSTHLGITDDSSTVDSPSSPFLGECMYSGEIKGFPIYTMIETTNEPYLYPEKLASFDHTEYDCTYDITQYMRDPTNAYYYSTETCVYGTFKTLNTKVPSEYLNPKYIGPQSMKGSCVDGILKVRFFYSSIDCEGPFLDFLLEEEKYLCLGPQRSRTTGETFYEFFTCFPKWCGEFSETQKDLVCNGRGRCVQKDMCDCEKGYYGSYCEEE